MEEKSNSILILHSDGVLPRIENMRHKLLTLYQKQHTRFESVLIEKMMNSNKGKLKQEKKDIIDEEQVLQLSKDSMILMSSKNRKNDK